MSSSLSTFVKMIDSDPSGTMTLSIALIGPNQERRSAVAAALSKYRGATIREFPSYPPALDDVARLLQLAFDVVAIDVDCNPEYALQVVENICTHASAMVIAFSSSNDPELKDRCRRAGARECLAVPFDDAAVAGVLAQAAGHPARNASRTSGGSQLVFFGAKGGSGTTTIACSYAVALAKTSKQRTILIDLGFPLGDAALNLGIAPEHSTEEAFAEVAHLDASRLESFTARHASGVFVLAAPGKIPSRSPSAGDIDLLLAAARAAFDYVVVDAGSRVDLMETALFHAASTVYMVTQAGITELRNADRLIELYFKEEQKKLEIVVNRFDSENTRISEDQMTKALGRPVQWKISDDYDATRQLQNADAAQSNTDSPFARSIVEMASSVARYPIPEEFKKAFNMETIENASATLDNQLPHNTDGSSTGNFTPSSDGGDLEQASTSPASFDSDGVPNVNWQTPETINYGTPLSQKQLNATASVPGEFAYTPGAGYMLPAGTHTLWVTFTPSNGPMVQSAVSITVAKAAPVITWPAPAPISCYTTLGEAQLNAGASVPGKLEYSPAAGVRLEPGQHTLTVKFAPVDQKNYLAVTATAPLTVERIVPSIDWRAPEKIPCGSALSTKQLNAKASVPGTFVYKPAAGEVLEPGQHTLTVYFTPADGMHYVSAQGTINVTVMKPPPRVTWAAPDPIVYGTPLSTAQLNAAASVDGRFDYTPGMGAVLAVGMHTPSVTFNPNDDSDYSNIPAAVPLTVVMARPALTWNEPEAIPYGTALSATQLNATSTVPGTFVYRPAAGELPPPGTHKLSVTFTPVDTMNFEPAKATVTLTVKELERVEITWPAPRPIQYGIALGDNQLNASATVPGTFAYGPCAGNVLPPGKHTLWALFTPAESWKFATVQATVTLQVEALPDIAPLLSGAVLSPMEQDLEIDQPDPASAEREFVRPRSIPAEREAFAMNAAAARAAAPGPGARKSSQSPMTTTTEPAAATPAGGNAVGSSAAPSARTPRETRTYKGLIYEKGEDGQWHRQQK